MVVGHESPNVHSSSMASWFKLQPSDVNFQPLQLLNNFCVLEKLQQDYSSRGESMSVYAKKGIIL